MALVLDQVTKQIAVRELADGASVRVVGDALKLVLVKNPGAAFSTGANYTFYLSLISCVAALVVVWLLRRVGPRSWAIALGLLLAGILGNLGDRLFRQPGPMRGHVIDFLQLPNWPVFNLADIWINAGAVLMAVLVLRGVSLRGADAEPRDQKPSPTGPSTGSSTGEPS